MSQGQAVRFTSDVREDYVLADVIERLCRATGLTFQVRGKSKSCPPNGSGTTVYFHETALNQVGGAQLPPQVLREAEERKQLRQVLFELLDQARISRLPI